MNNVTSTKADNTPEHVQSCKVLWDLASQAYTSASTSQVADWQPVSFTQNPSAGCGVVGPNVLTPCLASSTRAGSPWCPTPDQGIPKPNHATADHKPTAVKPSLAMKSQGHAQQQWASAVTPLAGQQITASSTGQLSPSAEHTRCPRCSTAYDCADAYAEKRRSEVTLLSTLDPRRLQHRLDTLQHTPPYPPHLAIPPDLTPPQASTHHLHPQHGCSFVAPRGDDMPQT